MDSSPYFETPEDPLYETLKALTGKEPPEYTKGIESSYELGDRSEELQSWCVNNCVPEWGTGIGFMDAADHIVSEAISNANIAQKAPREFTEEEQCAAWSAAVARVKNAGDGNSYMGSWIRRSTGDPYIIRHVAVRDIDLRGTVACSRVADPNGRVVIPGQFLTLTIDLERFLQEFRLKDPDEYHTDPSE